MFRCKFKIDSDSKKVTLENGPSLRELGELLSKLGKCLESKKVKFILTDIQEGSYTALIDTENEEDVNEFDALHDKLLKEPFDALDEDEQSYSVALAKILFDNGLYVATASDIHTEDKIIRSINVKKPSKYHLITTVNARLVSINGKNEKSPYITIKTTDNKLIKLFVSAEQESAVSHFYKESLIRFRVRIKSEISEGEEQRTGKLIDFAATAKRSFNDAVIDVRSKYKSIFSSISDSAKMLNQIRNAPTNE